METHSKDYIIEAFFCLLREHDYFTVDVSKICRKAGVSRTTFYRIFQSKEDIIKAYFARSEFEFLSANSPMTPFTHPEEFIYSCFEKLSKEKDNLMALYRQGLIRYLSEALNEGVERDFHEHQRGSKAEAYLYAGAVANLETYYLSEGATASPEELTEDFLTFLHYERTAK
jgi:AcrR family transcriptional regulator